MSMLARIRTAALATAVAATTVATIAGPAVAADPRHDPRGGRGWQRPVEPSRHAPPRTYEPREKRHDNTARNVAIGIGALILGAILSDEARRARSYD